MARFKIEFETSEGEHRSEIVEFEDWTGHAMLDGTPIGPLMTITAREWAEDAAYTMADKHAYTIEEL